MNVIIDACSLINLHNGNCLALVPTLSETRIWVGPEVLRECNSECAMAVLSLANRGEIGRIDDFEVGAERFLHLLDRFGLGPGETECLVVAEQNGFVVCSDDRRARTSTEIVLGQNRCIGTARLLKWCVRDRLFSCTDALRYFDLMKMEGGHLPNLEARFFCEV